VCSDGNSCKGGEGKCINIHDRDDRTSVARINTLYGRSYFRRSLIIFKELQINQNIRDKEVRVVSETGEQLGIMSSNAAQRIADEKGLDLVKISPTANPPVCKIMDYGKYRFDLSKKEKEARKSQKVVENKEIWLSMTIDDHDIEVKAKQGRKFLESGNKLKVLIKMRGRQMVHSVLGIKVMDKFLEYVKDVCVVDKKAVAEGRSITMMLGPVKDSNKQ